jgi:hypothetical protein
MDFDGGFIGICVLFVTIDIIRSVNCFSHISLGQSIAMKMIKNKPDVINNYKGVVVIDQKNIDDSSIAD